MNKCVNPWHDSAPGRAQGKMDCPECPKGNDLGEWVELAELLGLRTIKSPDGTEIVLFRHGNLDGGLVQVKATTITYVTTDGRGMDHREEVTPMKAVIILTKMTKTYQCEVCTVYLGQGETHDHAD